MRENESSLFGSENRVKELQEITRVCWRMEATYVLSI